MTGTDPPGSQPAPPSETSILEQLFYPVGSVVPERQELAKVAPNTSVDEAVDQMMEHNYSQLPVVRDGTVFGMFSFRSLVSELVRNPNLRADCTALPVNLFIEEWRFVQPSERWESIVNCLDKDNGVLVRWADQRLSIVTAMDVVQFLTRITGSFMLLAEIELALRQLIRACIPSEQLNLRLRTALGAKYSPDKMPKSLEEMEFADYSMFLGDSENWALFSPVFGDGEVLRRDAVNRLDEVRILRNDVFHFRRRLTEAEEKKLCAHRDWLRRRTLLAETHRLPPEPIIWKQGTFLRALQGTCGTDAVSFAEKVLTWARELRLTIKWGEGQTLGAFHIRLKHQGKPYHLFSVWSNGNITLWFWRYARFAPFESADERSRLLARLNAIEGIKLPQDAADREPAIHYGVLTEATARQAFLSTYEWVVDRIKGT